MAFNTREHSLEGIWPKLPHMSGKNQLFKLQKRCNVVLGLFFTENAVIGAIPSPPPLTCLCYPHHSLIKLYKIMTYLRRRLYYPFATCDTTRGRR